MGVNYIRSENIIVLDLLSASRSFSKSLFNISHDPARALAQNFLGLTFQDLFFNALTHRNQQIERWFFPLPLLSVGGCVRTNVDTLSSVICHTDRNSERQSRAREPDLEPVCPPNKIFRANALRIFKF